MYKKLPPEGQKHMLEQMGQAPAFVFEFTDRTIVQKPGDAPAQTATYKVLKTEGATLSLELVSKKKDGSDFREDTNVEVVDPDTIKLSKTDGDMVFMLRRVK